MNAITSFFTLRDRGNNEIFRSKSSCCCEDIEKAILTSCKNMNNFSREQKSCLDRVFTQSNALPDLQDSINKIRGLLLIKAKYAIDLKDYQKLADCINLIISCGAPSKTESRVIYIVHDKKIKKSNSPPQEEYRIGVKGISLKSVENILKDIEEVNAPPVREYFNIRDLITAPSDR